MIAVVIILLVLGVLCYVFFTDIKLKLGMYPASNWTCVNSPNSQEVAFRRNAYGDIECQSADGKNCRYEQGKNCQYYVDNPIDEKPLSCGAAHLAAYGITGYDTPAHWCATVNQKINRPATHLSYEWSG